MNYKDFEEHIPQGILSKGKTYCESGAVEDLEKSDGHWLANVHGSETYEVAVKGIRSIKSWDCDCPYDHGPICKHVAAVLYAVQAKGLSKGTAKVKKNKNQVDEVFKNTPPEELLKFFKKNIRFHKNLKQKLLTEFIHVLDEGDKDRYKKIVDTMVKNAGGRYGYIEYKDGKKLGSALDKLVGQASVAMAKKNYVDALDICAAVLLKIPNLLLEVDDSSGALQGSCYAAREVLQDLLEGPTPPIFKDQVFAFMLHAFEQDKTDFDSKDELLAILLQQDLEATKLHQIRKVVQTAFDNLTGNHIEYSQSYYISLLIDIAEQLKEDKEFDRLINEHLHFSSIRKMKVEMLLRQEEFELAKQVIAEGIQIAEEKSHPGTVRQWKDVLIKVSRLEKDETEERQLLLAAFMEGRFNMDYFLQYKNTFTDAEWLKERELVITRVLGNDKTINYSNTHTIAKIYVEEKLDDRLLELLQIEKMTYRLIYDYGHHLHDKFPKEMLTMYEPILIEAAGIADSRSGYSKVAKQLKDLLKIKGGRAVVERLLTEFRTKYVRRPAMMDELRGVL